VKLENRSKCGDRAMKMQGKRKGGNHQRGEIGRKPSRGRKRQVESTDSALHHPTIEDGENS